MIKKKFLVSNVIHNIKLNIINICIIKNKSFKINLMLGILYVKLNKKKKINI